MLVDFLQHVDAVVMVVTKAQATKQLSTISMKMLLSIYSYWTQHNLLPEDVVANNKVTLLDNADTWLTESA